jgi:hypothetical protein
LVNKKDVSSKNACLSHEAKEDRHYTHEQRWSLSDGTWHYTT